MKKLYGGINFTWIKIILTAVISGVLTGLFNSIPVFAYTSFTVPAVTAELWIVLALIIVLNCNKLKDAILKTFVFFVISQPLIYLTEVPFNDMGWELFSYYPRWAVFTVLTIPAAAVAFQVKKSNILSAVILSVATGYLFYSAINSVSVLLSEFPKYLIHITFCLFFATTLIVFTMKNKKEKIIASLITIIAGFLVFIIPQITGTVYTGKILLDSQHKWTLKNPVSGFDIDFTDDGYLTYKSKVPGSSYIDIIDENGNVKTYIIHNENVNSYVETVSE